MPEPIQTQNNPMREAAQFESDMASFYKDAQKQDALDFADSLDRLVDQTAKNFDGQMSRNGTSEIGRAGIGFGRDVSLGILQAPREVARGVTKGLNGVLDAFSAVHDLLPAPSWVDNQGNRTGDLLPEIVTQGTARERNDKFFQKNNIDFQRPSDARIPVPNEPAYPTVTGAGIEAISQFMTGFGIVGKVGKALGVKEAASGLGAFAQSVGKGALADMLAFDGHDQRLSNVIEAVPALKNPVTDYLASSPDDSAAVAKFKQGVEGVLTGAIGEGLFRGVTALKKLKSADDALKAEGKTWDQAIADIPLEEQAGVGLEAKNFRFLGNPDSPDLFLPKDKIAQAAEEVQGAFGKTKQLADAPAASIPDYQINFARINGPDDIKQLMDDMVNRPELKISIEEARRGTQSNSQTLLNAQDIDGFDSMMQRRVGDAFNADQITAARRVYYDTTDKLMEAARKASSPEASDIDVFNFRKMVAVHHAVQKEFMGVRAEAGRALQAWSINLGGTPSQNLRLMEQTLADFGGADVGKDLARRLSAVGDLTTDQINAITRGGALARTGKAVEEVWTLGLLTNPQTHVVNLSSNILTTLNLGLERLAMALPKDSPVTVREGLEFWSAIMESQKMAIKNAAQAFRTGESQFGGMKIENQMVRNSAREILDPEGKAGLASKALDWWGGVLSKYVGGGLMAADEYNKTVLYQAQLRSLAVRQAITQGVDSPSIGRYVADTLANPPEALMADAEMFAKYGTFTKELGKYGQAFQTMVSRVPGARFVVPFIRTPANIFKFTFERTPLALASGRIRDDIAAGGIRRATAMTRIGMGTTTMFMGVDLALNGKITGSGPSDPETRSALRRTGWQPYSVKIGDSWYSYARFEPMATLLGMSADMAEILSNYEAYDIRTQSEADELVTAGIIAMSNQVVGKTFMRGFADMTEALSDPKRYGEGFLQRFAGSFVPAGSAALERAIDPSQEQVFNMMDSVRSRIPGLSEFVPPKRNIWGEEIKTFTPSDDPLTGTSERVFSLFNPVYYSKEGGSPVDSWLVKNGFDIDMPDKTQVFDGVRIDLRDHPYVYDDLVRERGSGVRLMKYGDQTMKEFFDGLATENDPTGRHVGFYMAIGNDYQDQKNFISGVVKDYTKAARDVVFEKYADTLGPEIDVRKREAMRLNDVRGPLGQ